MLLQIFFQVVIILIFPFISKRITSKTFIGKWISPVVICYLVGISIGSTHLLAIDTKAIKGISEALLLIAIPLLLYSTKLSHDSRYAKTTLLSFAFCAISGFIASGIAAFLFHHKVEESWKISGMLAGLYTGGTPNLQAIGLALQTNSETIILLNTCDVFTGGIYLVFLTSFAHRFFGLFLGDFKIKYGNNTDISQALLFEEIHVKDSIKAILYTIVLLTFSLCMIWLIFGNLDQIIFILLMITSLSIGSSFLPLVRRWKGTFETGELFLLAFCVALGMLANFDEIISTGKDVLIYTSFVLFGTITLHLLLAKLFKIDRDTFMITSTAGVYGPAFIGQIASAIGNKELVFPGMAMGLLGYALGNYWGLGLAYLLKLILLQ